MHTLLSQGFSMGSAMSHHHHNFNLDIQQYCGSRLATEKTRFPSSRMCSKSNASEQRQSSTKWRPCPEGFTPTASQPGSHLRPSTASQGGLTAALPQHRPLSTKCFILNSAKSPTALRCSRVGFCYLHSAELADVWLAHLS